MTAAPPPLKIYHNSPYSQALLLWPEYGRVWGLGGHWGVVGVRVIRASRYSMKNLALFLSVSLGYPPFFVFKVRGFLFIHGDPAVGRASPRATQALRPNRRRKPKTAHFQKKWVTLTH